MFIRRFVILLIMQKCNNKLILAVLYCKGIHGFTLIRLQKKERICTLRRHCHFQL